MPPSIHNSSRLNPSFFGSLVRRTLDCSAVWHCFASDSPSLRRTITGRMVESAFLTPFKLHFQGYSRTRISCHATDLDDMDQICPLESVASCITRLNNGP